MLTRRRFLSNSCALGVASSLAPLVSTANSVPEAEISGYRALVCILLAGGNDSFNMLVPADADQHAEYTQARGNLALQRNDLLLLPGRTANGRRYGLHPGLVELRDLYASDEAALVANVGTLCKPNNDGALRPASNKLPEQLLSHSGQIGRWQTCSPDAQTASGWAGRMADVLQERASQENMAMNLSVSGRNMLQLGELTSPHNVESTSTLGTRNIPGIPTGVDFDFVNEQMALRVSNTCPKRQLDRRAARQRITEANTKAAISRAAQQAPTLRTQFPADPFSRGLAEIARLIAARDSIGSRRQIFFVSFNGWDHHHQLLSSHATMLPILGQGLKAFRDALVELGVFDNVTTFSISEFGRSLTSNGSGSDHGWGGHHFVMGGSVKASQICGSYPDLSQSNPLNIGDGVYAPTTSTDEYFAELALWLGVPASQLDYVFPNLRAFYSPATESRPIGFLA